MLYFSIVYGLLTCNIRAKNYGY